MNGYSGISSAEFIDLGKQLFQILFRVILYRFIPDRITCFRIKKYEILYISIADSFKIFRITFYSCNIISKIFNSHYFIHHYFYIMSYFVICVHINRAFI